MFTQRFSPPVAAAVAACVMAATAVFADTDEAALYAPDLPSDAIFLRWVDTDVPLPALGLTHQPVAGQEAYRPLSARHLTTWVKETTLRQDRMKIGNVILE